MHHRLLKDNKKNELDLVESISKLDFATMDFVSLFQPQLFHHYFKEKTIKTTPLDIKTLKTPEGYFDATKITPKHRELYRLNGMKIISEGKLAVVLFMSEVIKYLEEYKTIGIQTMEGIPSKKRFLEILVRKIKLLGERSKTLSHSQA